MGVVVPKKIVIITAGQPSLNPRLVKEADALAENGYNVLVIHAYWSNLGSQFNSKLFPQKKWDVILTGGSPETKPLIYLLSRVMFKFADSFSRLTGSMLLAKFAVARSAYFLTQEAKKHKADIYIGHNLGALPATVTAAKKYGRPCGFDAEDFHRNEISDDANNFDVRLKTNIEDKYFPRITYFSASSIQIADAYHQLYPYIHPLVLTNVFPKSNYSESELTINNHQPLKLFWFSQTIGPKRGLENLISALSNIDYQCNLHLLGSCTDEYKNELGKSNVTIHFHQPMPPDELMQFASQFDIGLALEPGFSNNNNLALSNKIFTYLQAGLAVIASDTKAQTDLLINHPAIGKLFTKDDPKTLASQINYYHRHREELVAARLAALRLAQTDLNWETESRKFMLIINNLLTV